MTKVSQQLYKEIISKNNLKLQNCYFILAPQIINNTGIIMSDNGFLKLDNSIIDYWMSRLNHSEFKTLLTVYRKTVGWGKQYDRISQNQIAELSGITPRSVRSAITSLESLGLIITTGKNKSAKVFTLNTNNLFNVCLKSDDIVEMENALLENNSKNLGSGVKNSELNTSDDVENFPHKRHYEYTNNKKVKDIAQEVNIPFDVFWDFYDYKKNRSLCLTKWHSMTDEERTLTIEHLDAYIKSTPDKTYRKYPINYLENECWLDEVSIPVDSSVGQRDSTYTGSTNNNNQYKDNSSQDVYSASFKEFNPTIPAHDNENTQSTEDIEYTNSLDLLSQSSQTHWSELKKKGLLKKKTNPNAVIPNTDKDKEINDFLARMSSKRFSNSADKNILVE